MKRHLFRLTAALTALIYLAGCALSGEDNPRAITGTVEAREVNINTKIPGRVINIKVVEGQGVAAGDILAYIDDRDLKARERQIGSQLEATRATVQKAEVAARLAAESCSAAITQAEATLEKARANTALKEKTWARVKELFEHDAAPVQKLDEAETDLAAARAEVKYLEGKLAEARAAELNLPLRQAEVEAAGAQYNQASAALEEIILNLEETVIKAPCSGTVTALNVEEGEMVSQGTPLLVLTDFSDNWVNVKVPQDMLAEIELGGKAAVSPEASREGTCQGEIININKKPEFATTRATSDRGEKDIVSYNVKIKLNTLELHPGMLVKVEF